MKRLIFVAPQPSPNLVQSGTVHIIGLMGAVEMEAVEIGDRRIPRRPHKDPQRAEQTLASVLPELPRKCTEHGGIEQIDRERKRGQLIGGRPLWIPLLDLELAG